MADPKWLKKDKEERYKKEREKEQRQLQQHQELMQRRQRERDRLDERKRLWMTFHDGHGFNMVMDFTWYWCHEFFIEAFPQDPHNMYNYVWSCPEYPDGNNTIRPYYGTVRDFCKPYGRDKGKHLVRSYCPGAYFVAELYQNRKLL